MACGPVSGSSSNRFRRASSICLIWPITKPSRAMSRSSTAETFGRSGEPSGVRRAARRSVALRRVGLKLRMPSRARVPFMRFTMRVRSLTRHSRSRLGRLASSSAIVGTRTMLQWPRSPRSHPRATFTRLPGDAPPRNDPRGDSTIFVPNSEPSPQTYRGSALQRSAPFRVETALSICSMSRHPTSWKLGARSRSRPEIRRPDPTEPRSGYQR